jgi:hypothetical protein
MLGHGLTVPHHHQLAATGTDTITVSCDDPRHRVTGRSVHPLTSRLGDTATTQRDYQVTDHRITQSRNRPVIRRPSDAAIS